MGDVLSIADPLLAAERSRSQSSAAVQNPHNTLQQKKPTDKSNLKKRNTFFPDRQGRVSDMLYRTAADIPFLLKTTDLLIVNKPAGIPVHGSYSIDALLSNASGEFPTDKPSAAESGNHPPQSLSFKQGPLHRLDKDTTGVLCFSRTLAGAQWFSQCLRKKTVDKYYLGIVRGFLSIPLITTDDESGKSITQCYPLSYNKEINVSLILFKLITGKKHQIRKHSASVGHPLVGDRKYGGGNPFFGCTRYQLHAWRLYFPASRAADIPSFVEAPFFPEMETCLSKTFSGWRKKAVAILTNQTQAIDNF